jgi:hypothetical protein
VWSSWPDETLGRWLKTADAETIERTRRILASVGIRLDDAPPDDWPTDQA